jgi:hypothetical protein
MTWCQLRISCLLKNVLERVPQAALGCALIAAVLTLLPETGRSQPCAPVPPGLVGWWTGDNTAQDEVGGAHGTLVGNAGYAPGRVGAAFSFDGSGDAVNLGNPAALQLQDFTIEAWIQRTSLDWANHGMILASGLDGYGFSLTENGTLYLSFIGHSSVESAAQVADTGWHHVAVTKSGSVVVFYLDGTAYLAPDFYGELLFEWNVAIGASGDFYANSFGGLIDELSVYSRALSAAEVAAISAAGSSGKCAWQAPRIVAQPQSQTVTVGASATLSVSAS